MPQPTPFDTILVQCRDLFADSLCGAVGGMLDGAGESLSVLAEKNTEDELQKRYLDAKDVVANGRDVIGKQFRTRYLAEFQKRTHQAKKIGESFSDFSLDDLQLVEEDDLNETLKFNDMATRLRGFCEAELSALDQRVGVLMGDAALESDDNPFGPQVICDAYKQACRQLETTTEMRMVLLKLFDDHVLDTIRASYKEVNDLLVQNSILPKIRYGIAKQEGGKSPGAEATATKRPKAEDAPAAAQPAGDGEDMFARLAKMLAPGAGAAGPGAAGQAGAGAGGGMGVGGAPLVQGAELMGSLTRLQVGDLASLGEAAAELGPILAEAGNLKNVLRQMKATSVGAGLGQVDSMTLDIVAMLFDELFDDPKVPIALKGLIGRLQLPMLKVAIADKDLFTRKSHPARQLLDTLGEIGARLPADFDSSNPVFPRLESFVQELVDGFQEKMEIFDEVRARLEAIIAEDDQRVAREMEASSEKLRQAESLAVAKSVAQDEIRARVEGASAPRPVAEFVAQQWIKYMVIVHAREGKESAAWKGALETIDQLLWSVVPKATPEERRKVPAVIPGLLKRLKLGIAAAGIEDGVAAAFMAELMKCHAEVMHAPAAPAAAPSKKKKGEPDVGVKKGDAAPAAPAAKKPAPTPDLDFTAPVTVNNPFGAGKVDVKSEDLDFTAATEGAALATEPAADAPPAKSRGTTIRLPSSMVIGAWVEILEAGDEERRIPARLYYVSPMKSHFLFVDRKGKKVYECSRSMLARRHKLGEVRLLDGEPDASLFDRIMDGLFGKLRTAPAA